MNEEIKCPNCGQAIDPSASFCGNCGQKLANPPPPSVIANTYQKNTSQASSKGLEVNNQTLSPTAGGAAALPAYAVTHSHPHGVMKLSLTIVFGILGIAGAFFIPIVGIGFGIAGIILASLVSAHTLKKLKVAGIFFSILAILAGLGTWVEIASHDPRLHAQSPTQAATSGGTTSLSVVTPCYSIIFSQAYNVSNAKGSCSMNAYNGGSLETSTDIFKVISSSAPNLTLSTFDQSSKTAIENDIKQSLPGFYITNEFRGEFASYPAYYVQANLPAQNISVEEATVMDNKSNSHLVLVMVHLTNGLQTNLNQLESQWQWL